MSGEAERRTTSGTSHPNREGEESQASFLKPLADLDLDLDLAVMMKKAVVLAASLAAASSGAFAVAASDHRVASISSSTIAFAAPDRRDAFSASAPSSGEARCGSAREKGAAGSGATERVKDKFAPRFDGLRFIETLVTAHR